MDYTPEILKEHLGDAYDPDAEYVVDTPNGAVIRAWDSAWKKVGEVPDSRLGNRGTKMESKTSMIVFKRVTKKEGTE